MTLVRLTVLNPGKRRTADTASNGNGRNCFMPSEVWTAGMVGRTRACMRPFWHVLPVGRRAKAACYSSRQQQTEAWVIIVQFTSSSVSVFSLCRLNVSSHWATSYPCYCVIASAYSGTWFQLKYCNEYKQLDATTLNNLESHTFEDSHHFKIKYLITL